jgi:hypothetical protein
MLLSVATSSSNQYEPSSPGLLIPPPINHLCSCHGRDSFDYPQSRRHLLRRIVVQGPGVIFPSRGRVNPRRPKVGCFKSTTNRVTQLFTSSPAYVLQSAPSHIGFPVGHSLNHTCALPLRRPGLYPPLWGRRRLAQVLGLNKGYN